DQRRIEELRDQLDRARQELELAMTTVKGTQDYSVKVLEFTNANINAAVEHATKLMSVKAPMEFFELSNDYAKRQFVILTRQAQELAAIVQKMTIAKDR